METIKIPESYKYLGIFLTMKCNLNCSFCLNEMDNKTRNNFKELSGEEWVRSLNRIESRPDVPITFGGGEPTTHKDFTYIINNLKPSLNIDLLTNLSYEKGIEKLLRDVNPDRIKRDSNYASIRVSYHPEQMGNGEKLVGNVKRLQNQGFSVGIWSVLYPSPDQLSSINQMQFRCKENGIDFRVKEFTGEYKGEMYGDYSKYPDSISKKSKSCLCKTSELLIGPDGNVYKCHRDLYKQEFPIGNITDPNFKIESKFRECNEYGNCHYCDVKVKTNFKQKLGHTSVDIIFPERRNKNE